MVNSLQRETGLVQKIALADKKVPLQGSFAWLAQNGQQGFCVQSSPRLTPRRSFVAYVLTLSAISEGNDG
jgi:hypothetical protein